MRKRWLLAPLMTCLTACGGGAEAPETIYFSALERDVFTPAEFGDPGPRASAAEIQKMSEVFSSFERDPERVLSAPLISPGQLDSIESAYISSGRYFDLLAMYRAVATKQGLGSRAAARHTWGLIRLGQGDTARARALELVRHDPTSARAWFVYGASMLEKAKEDEDAAARVHVAWTRAVELDPKFIGIEGFRAQDLTQEAESARTLSKGDDATFAAILTSITGASGATPPEPGPEPTDEATEGGDPVAPAPDAPLEVAPVEDPAGDPATTPAKEPAAVAPEVTPDTPEVAAPEPLALGLMKARMAASGGDTARAKAELGLARARHLGGDLGEALARVDVAQALEYVRLEWAVGDRTRAARAWRALTTRPGMTPAQRYEVAMFGAREVEDLGTALELLRALEKDAPEYAAKVGVGRVIESLAP